MIPPQTALDRSPPRATRPLAPGRSCKSACKSASRPPGVRLSRIVWLAVTAAAAASLPFALGIQTAGCGPSFQVVYEGDVRFEHCYAVDESVTSSIKQKADCWRDWLKDHTYGQTRDRVEYAAARNYALSVAPLNPTDQALMEAAPGGGVRKNVISAPMPTSVYATPPSTLADPDAKADAGPAADPKTAVVLPKINPPGADCADVCTKDWNACKDTCKAAGCDTCDTVDRSCMRACFKDVGPVHKKP